jgi:hypothetical protein
MTAQTDMPARSLPRVVAVGFNKCGTRSFADLFRKAGHRVIHHKVRDRWPVPRKIGQIMQANLAAGRKVFGSVENYDFYCDLIFSTKTGTFDGAFAFREILRDYPDTILLLNLRDREQWIRSRLKHGHGEFAKREIKARGLTSIDALTAEWRAEWDAHIAAVRQVMADFPAQYIEFNLDRDDPAALAAALPDWHLNPVDFLDIGRTRGVRTGRVLHAVKTFAAHVRPRFNR